MGHTLYEASHYEDEETIKKNLELNNTDRVHGNDNDLYACMFDTLCDILSYPYDHILVCTCIK